MEVSTMIMANVFTDTVWPVMMLVFGFGMVIFFHEFGHYLAARAVGIKIERLALGFGPRLIGFHKGETDYCINLLPLGGYVKMLGQEDFNPVEEEEGEKGQGDPRSFANKSISARMLVASAGVAMNIVVAAVLFIIICMVGIRLPAAIAGGASPGSPAGEVALTWQGEPGATTMPSDSVGIEAGDKIVELDGQEVTRFTDLIAKAAFAGLDDEYDVTVRRNVSGQIMTGRGRMGVMPDPRHPGRKLFGIAMPIDTLLGEAENLHMKSVFLEDDRVVAINGQDVKHHWDIEPIEKMLDGSDVTVTIQRGEDRVNVVVRPKAYLSKVRVLADGTVLHVESATLVEKGKEGDKSVKLKLADGSERTVKVEEFRDEQLDVLGMIPRVRVMAVVKGSPAAKAGMKPGDVIVSYANRAAPTLFMLHELNAKYADEAVNVVILRDSKTLPTASITPKGRNGGAQIGIHAGVDVDHMVIAGIRKGSHADEVGLQAGDVIEQINGREVKTWSDIVAARRAVKSGRVTIKYRRGSLGRTATTPDVATAKIKAADYNFSVFANELPFRGLRGPLIKKGPLAALKWGANETYDFVAMTYATLRGLIMQTVSPKELLGPVGIVDIGIKVGRKGVIELLRLLAIISVSLAVINFLPLPVVDGGMAMFLIVEKVRGKPISVKVMNVIQIVGIVLLIGVFLSVTFNDIMRIFNR